MIATMLTMEVRFEQDVVLVRQQARQIAELLGFSAQDQTRIATAVSEITRNAFKYAGGGKVDFVVKDNEALPSFLIRVSDTGPGIADVPSLLDGWRVEPGMGLAGARRLMDRFTINSSPGHGTVVLLEKDFPPAVPPLTRTRLAQLTSRLAKLDQQSPVEELRHQNHELLQILEELRSRQEELTQLNRELEDTNRGVLALYAELEEKAEQLRQAAELKSRFLSYMSHEFRTPLNAVLTLSQILLNRLDGDLSPEQEKQVAFIRKAAQDLTELTNDLLNLAKIEAGKIAVNPAEFEVAELFSTLRGMMRPLEVNPAVSLTFLPLENAPPLYTDEGKVAQILRNLVSNALKFTEQGEVRVAASLAAGGGQVIFSVADSGIGIAPEDQERIFDDFIQLETRLHRRAEGTGLGLALSRRLARLLGGDLTVQSQPNVGSTFTAVIPRVYTPAGISLPMPNGLTREGDRARVGPAGQKRNAILIIDDDETARYTLKKLLQDSIYTVSEAKSGPDGLRQAREEHPQVIFLDLMMPDMSGFEVLAQLKAAPATRATPVIIYTSGELRAEDYNRIQGAEALLSKQDISTQQVIATIEKVLGQAGAGLASLSGGGAAHVQ